MAFRAAHQFPLVSNTPRKLVTHLAKREQETLEERSGFVDRLLERHVGLNRQLSTRTDLLSNLFQQDLLVKLLTLLWVQVGCEDSSRGVSCVRGPLFGVRDHDEGRPH